MKLCFFVTALLSCVSLLRAQDIYATMAAEISTTTALVQVRVGEVQRKELGFLRSVEGWARFEASTSPEFTNSIYTAWVPLSEANNYIARAVLGGERVRGAKDSLGKVLPLEPDTLYYYRAIFGPTPGNVRLGPVQSFRTSAGAANARNTRILVLQGLDVNAPGFSLALAKAAATRPDYVVFAGNSVAYDSVENKAQTAEAMRAAWHRLLSHAALRNLVSTTGVFWMKNDRDFRFTAADMFSPGKPDGETGIKIFREQLPLLDPSVPSGVTFRSTQLTRDVGLWMLETRDYRSASTEVDDLKKSLLGSFQIEWLQRSMKSAMSAFKIIVTPTPIIGSNAIRPGDSHASGYTAERNELLNALNDQNLIKGDVLIISGGSDSLYHSQLGDTLHEIGIGAISPSGAHTEKTVAAADSQIHFSAKKPSFTVIEIKARTITEPATLTATLHSAETGEALYTLTRSAAGK